MMLACLLGLASLAGSGGDGSRNVTRTLFGGLGGGGPSGSVASRGEGDRERHHLVLA